MTVVQGEALDPRTGKACKGSCNCNNPFIVITKYSTGRIDGYLSLFGNVIDLILM